MTSMRGTNPEGELTLEHLLLHVQSKLLGCLGRRAVRVSDFKDGEDETPAMNHLGSEASQARAFDQVWAWA